MKGDFSRSTFKRKNHYRSVRMQQGRVQLDSDWNEQADINNYHIETDVKDVIGKCGAPFHEKTGVNDNRNFEIRVTDDGKDFEIARGHIYVNGILCENDLESPRGSDQPDLPPLPEDVDLTADMPFIPLRDPQVYSGGKYLAFLDVWQRHITYLDDENIREVALGGPDTATRAKTVWQVKLLSLGEAEGDVNCLLDDPRFNTLVAGSTGMLSAKTTDPGTFGPDPCILPSGGGYRRLKNQLYRVEIHDGGGRDTATFKWSRDNGTVVVKWKSIKDGNKLTVIDPGRGILSCFAAGKWIELTDDIHELWGLPGKLVRLEDVQDELFTIDPASITGTIDMADFPVNPKARMWDSEGAEKVYQIPGEDWVLLGDDGIQVRFETGTYRTGDYWLIPARTETADIDWVKVGGEPEAQRPHGIKHHYCRLALLEANEGGDLTHIKDCRNLFPSLTELTSLSYIGGDGQEAMPGNQLPEPLKVGVSNGQWPVEGALVKFVVEDGGGTLAAADPVDSHPLIVKTDPSGVAQCEWTVGSYPYPGQPDNPPPHQRVKATLVDANHDEEFRLPVFFNANLSLAGQVAYIPQGCTSMGSTTTVQNAIDRLSHLTGFSYMCGDGQEAMPGEPLPQKLAVIVTNECGPVNGAVVRFVAEGNGRVAASKVLLGNPATTNTFNATAGPDGIAACYWKPDANGSSSQTLTATLQSAGVNPIHEQASMIFNASLSIAAEVAYRPTECGTDANPTVRSRLDIHADEDSSVADILDKLLCDFNATHLPILKDDDSLCGLLKDDPNVKTVQQALNALCRIQRGSGCCTLVGTARDIGETFNNLKDGDVICLLKGEPYDGDIKISGLNNIVIRGCSGGSRLNSKILITECSNVTLENLEISGSLISQKVNGLFLRKNNISRGESQGFNILSCENVRIENNTFNSQSAIHFQSGIDIEFSDNTIDYLGNKESFSSGIHAVNCDQLKIRENRLNVDSSVIVESYAHIEILNGQQVEISGNCIQTKISDNMKEKTISGVNITESGILIVSNNTIEGSNRSAIYVYQSHDVRIQGNNISGPFIRCAIEAGITNRLELLDNHIVSDGMAIEVYINGYLNMGQNLIETSAISFEEDTIERNSVVYIHDLIEGEITGNHIKIAYSGSLSNKSVWGLYADEVKGFFSVNHNRIDGLNANTIFMDFLSSEKKGISDLQGNLFNSLWYNDCMLNKLSKEEIVSNVRVRANDISFIGNRCSLEIKYNESLLSFLKQYKTPIVFDVLFSSNSEEGAVTETGNYPGDWYQPHALSEEGAVTATGNRCFENLVEASICSISAEHLKAAILLGNITSNKISPQPDPLKLNLIG
ncbi:Right handed beta helix region [uncultured archaeon]|nr:Right handed beta helix region [uncultured archaeon]